jgi:adenosylhomocysteine nucleosidase
LETTIILVCSDTEWDSITENFKNTEFHFSPFGKWFIHPDLEPATNKVIWFKSGWGKIGSAGATQYVIDTWKPDLIINIGTCGGIAGHAGLHQLLLVEKTVVYDLIDHIGKAGTSIADFTNEIELSWLKDQNILNLPSVVMATADQDVSPERITELYSKYNAIAGDWESGAIASICRQNKTRVLIIRGVSDIISATGNPAYKEDELEFREGVNIVMPKLMNLVSRFIFGEI